MTTKVCMAIVIACLAAASQAAAQFCEIERLHTRSEGEAVTADFSSVDTSTCALGIETTVHVDGSLGVTTLVDRCGFGSDKTITETITDTNVVNVVVSVYDHCLATQVLFATGTGEADDLHLSQNFKTASLRAAFEGVDDSNQTVSIAIDLVWNGVGQREHTGTHENQNQKIVKFVYASSGTMRDAIATGSVTVDDADQTPSESTQGTIERDAARELVAYR